MGTRENWAREKAILYRFNCTPSAQNSEGIDGYYNANGKAFPVEVKSFGANRPSLGFIDLDLSYEKNISNLLVSDIYLIHYQKTDKVLKMTKSQFTKWLENRVVLDFGTSKKGSRPKFRINWYERSKKQDRKLQMVGYL